MKRILIIVFSLLLAMGMLGGCQSTGEDGGKVISDGEPTFEDGINYDNETATEDGAFVGKEKIYTYRGNNVAILKLENHSDTHYTVTITAEFLDEFDTVLKRQTQTFEGFAAGWENHFFFKPDVEFYEFRYTLTTQVFSGECGVNSNSRMYFARTYETNMHRMIDVQGGKVPTLAAEFIAENMKASRMVLTQIVIDNQGEVCLIHRYESSGSGGGGNAHYPIYQTTEDALVIPENLQGELTGFVCFHSVEPRG
ncbi:MAG: hypothetical protein IJW40_00565 [Clostridia bacterium]|nr:hypothetical protein [Clostridia bacterium]